MKHLRRPRFETALLLATLLGLLLGTSPGRAVTTVFFDASQTVTLVSTNTTSDTIRTEGYLFTYTRDKLFTGGVGLTNPIGRQVRIEWPQGLEAQYVTSGPNPGKATITVRRVDGAVFDLNAFTARLLANAGAGRAIEIVPFRNGQEPLNDPLMFDVSGNYGNEFSYNTSPNYLGSTATLTNYDAYAIKLTLDYALMSLTLVDASTPPPLLTISQPAPALVEIAWPLEAADYTLESTTNLPPSNWTPVTNTVTLGTDCTVQLEPTAQRMFYRLRK